jgi:hypothetical protein
VRGSNPGGSTFSAPVQTGPGAHPASYTMGTGSFPGVKRPECGVDHTPSSNAEVKERLDLHLYSPSRSSWPVIGRNLPLTSENGSATVLTTSYQKSAAVILN